MQNATLQKKKNKLLINTMGILPYMARYKEKARGKMIRLKILNYEAIESDNANIESYAKLDSIFG